MQKPNNKYYNQSESFRDENSTLEITTATVFLSKDQGRHKSDSDRNFGKLMSQLDQYCPKPEEKPTTNPVLEAILPKDELTKVENLSQQALEIEQGSKKEVQNLEQQIESLSEQLQNFTTQRQNIIEKIENAKIAQEISNAQIITDASKEILKNDLATILEIEKELTKLIIKKHFLNDKKNGVSCDLSFVKGEIDTALHDFKPNHKISKLLEKLFETTSDSEIIETIAILFQSQNLENTVFNFSEHYNRFNIYTGLIFRNNNFDFESVKKIFNSCIHHKQNSINQEIRIRLAFVNFCNNTQFLENLSINEMQVVFADLLSNVSEDDLNNLEKDFKSQHAKKNNYFIKSPEKLKAVKKYFKIGFQNLF
jgi:hypothetical protein